MIRTLKGITSIEGVDVNYMEKRVDAETWNKIKKYININEDEHTISITIQEGPIKEVGVNGCQVTMLLEIFNVILTSAQATHPCKDNACTITHIEDALMRQERRTKNRSARGVEGTMKK